MSSYDKLFAIFWISIATAVAFCVVGPWGIFGFAAAFGISHAPGEQE